MKPCDKTDCPNYAEFDFFKIGNLIRFVVKTEKLVITTYGETIVCITCLFCKHLNKMDMYEELK